MKDTEITIKVNTFQGAEEIVRAFQSFVVQRFPESSHHKVSCTDWEGKRASVTPITSAIGYPGGYSQFDAASFCAPNPREMDIEGSAVGVGK